MAYQRGLRGTGSIQGQARDVRYSKTCVYCGETYYKYVCSSLKRWQTSRFCSASCRMKHMHAEGSVNKFQPGHAPPHKGTGHTIPCRGCGKPVLGREGNGAQHCGKPECREASKVLHYKRVGKALSRYGGKVGEGELALSPHLAARGWVPQLPVTVSGRTFRLDFASPEHKLCVEVDGALHRTAKLQKHDAERTQLLVADGWMVLRFWNSEVRDNLDGVLAAIWDY